MITYVALLRGINVGGNNRLPMADLTALLTSLGYTNVRTYLQSGNAIFEAEGTTQAIEASIEAGLLERFGLKIRVMVRTKDDLERIFAANPFKDEIIEADRTLFVSFLFTPLDAAQLKALEALSNPEELIAPRKNEVYTLLVRAHFPKSHMSANTLGKKLKVDSTARNWNTLSNLIERM